MSHLGPNNDKKRKREEEEIPSKVPQSAFDNIKSAFADVFEEIEETALLSFEENPQKWLLEEALIMMNNPDHPLQEIKYFLEKNNINLRARNRWWGAPPLVSVISVLAASHIERLQKLIPILLECGASAQDKDLYGDTPLHMLILPV